MSRPEDAFLDAAARIGAELCRDALWHGGRCNWLGSSLELADGAVRVIERSWGPTLYDGTAGIGLFLARLFRRTGERLFATTAAGAFAQATSRSAAVPPAERASFHSGWVGIAFAVLEAEQVLGREELGEAGRRMLEDAAAADPAAAGLDVIAGSASAVPALLRLGRGESAARHGERLLAAASRGEDGWSWCTLSPEAQAAGAVRPDLCGFAHGAAGVAAALVELGAAPGAGRYRAAAEQGFRYERRWFDPGRGNWPDLRRPGWREEDAAFRADWCHGAVGIGLSRLRAWELSGGEACAAEAAAAVRATVRALREERPERADWSLCHGTAGRLELLLEARGLPGADEAAGLAGEIALRAIERHHGEDEPWPCGVRGGGETPGLMLGLAGIGHLFLRLHDPAATPSVLLLRT
ncbi:MAG TPA: lanthionine synthetase LanC family protein [Thermoanaerobaculia bacterium]|nr:lanthionine synthetase LanC family protein [Thermoanaerobaculia bacterium]